MNLAVVTTAEIIGRGLLGIGGAELYSCIDTSPEDALRIIDERLIDSQPSGRWIALVYSNDRVIEHLRYGALGIIHAHGNFQAAMDCIKTIENGQIYAPAGLIQKAMSPFVWKKKPREHHITDRQREVVALAASGIPNKIIGERLGISEQTVKNHLHLAFPRLGVTSRAELIRCVSDGASV